jgi:hypothetical protein
MTKILIRAKIRRAAIEKLSKMGIPPLEKVTLAREYRVGVWLSQGVASLSKASCGVSVETMAGTLGWETAARILAIRDSAVKGAEKLEAKVSLAPSSSISPQLPDYESTLTRTPSLTGAHATMTATESKQNGSDLSSGIKKTSGYRGVSGPFGDTDILGVVRKHFGAEIRRLQY